MTNVNIVCKQLRWSVKQNHGYYCHILGIYNHQYEDGPYLHQCKFHAPTYHTDHIEPKNSKKIYLN